MHDEPLLDLASSDSRTVRLASSLARLCIGKTLGHTFEVYVLEHMPLLRNTADKSSSRKDTNYVRMARHSISLPSKE
jgi:hypothetical protein